MILSRGRGYIFIHAPKTGGTSMALALEGRAMKDDIMLGDTPKAKKRRRHLAGVNARGRLWKHSTLADLEGLLEPGEAERLFAFTLVRNPFDRVVSYYHWLQTQRFDHPAVGLAKRLDFEGFATHPEIAQSLAAAPARHYMTDAMGREQADLYIRLEHFEADAEPLWAHLGFRLELPIANRSARSADFRAYYSEASCAAVASACAEDIAKFGYCFAP